MKMKQQTCWTILRKFNYDKDLKIETAKLEDGTVPDEMLNSCKAVELSPQAILYLKRVYQSIIDIKVRDHRGHPLQEGLTENDLIGIFESAPEGRVPWRASLDTIVSN